MPVAQNADVVLGGVLDRSFLSWILSTASMVPAFTV